MGSLLITVSSVHCNIYHDSQKNEKKCFYAAQYGWNRYFVVEWRNKSLVLIFLLKSKYKKLKLF